MTNPDRNCALLLGAEQLARKRDLIKEGEKLHCGFAEICLGIVCQLRKHFEENPTGRTMWLNQQGVNSVPTGLERFYSRLNKTKAGGRERT